MNWITKPTQFMKVVTGDHKDLVQKKAIRILGRLINDTPKDTGFAAANWLPTISSPASGTRNSTEYSALESEAKSLFDPRGLPNFPVLYLTNNVEYIGVLNYGRPPGEQWSMKAPLNFVEAAIEAENK